MDILGSPLYLSFISHIKKTISKKMCEVNHKKVRKTVGRGGVASLLSATDHNWHQARP